MKQRRDVTKELLDEGWYDRCADEPDLTDHLGARNAIRQLLDYIRRNESSPTPMTHTQTGSER